MKKINKIKIIKIYIIKIINKMIIILYKRNKILIFKKSIKNKWTLMFKYKMIYNKNRYKIILKNNKLR